MPLPIFLLGPVRVGRSDTVTYRGGKGEPFKSVYVDNPAGRLVEQQRRPDTLVDAYQAVGYACCEVAARVAACWNACLGLPDPATARARYDQMVAACLAARAALVGPAHGPTDAAAIATIDAALAAHDTAAKDADASPLTR